MSRPRYAVCNIFDQDSASLAEFALEHGFEGIDWSFSLDLDEADFEKRMRLLDRFEVRYHTRFYGIDIAYADARAGRSMEIFKRIIRMISGVSGVGGGYVTVHIGLGQATDAELSWENGLTNLRNLVSYGAERGVVVCLENLTTTWTSRPELFERLIAESGAGVTFDIGHAHVCQKQSLDEGVCERFIAPHLERVYNAHIYHTEIPRLGHLPPKELDQIESRLDVLSAADACEWWVIELDDPKETLETRSILDRYIDLAVSAEQDILAMDII